MQSLLHLISLTIPHVLSLHSSLPSYRNTFSLHSNLHHNPHPFQPHPPRQHDISLSEAIHDLSDFEHFKAKIDLRIQRILNTQQSRVVQVQPMPIALVEVGRRMPDRDTKG
jgi:hypothetical protein